MIETRAKVAYTVKTVTDFWAAQQQMHQPHATTQTQLVQSNMCMKCAA